MLTLSGSAATLYCNDIKEEIITQTFERNEFKHEALKKALENTGTAPVIVQMIYGVPAQITSTGAVSTSVRPLTPDDSDLTNIYKKFQINRYTLTGTTSTNMDVTNANYFFNLHKQNLDRFDAHQKYSTGNVSYQELISLQAETFSYLYVTGLTFYSNTFGTITNALIRDFVVDGDYDIPQGGGNNLILKSWSMTLDSITYMADTP
jgi:hypothetical protein